MLQEELISIRLPYPGRADRLVRIFVPAREEGETFPVIYMTDGQNLFDEETPKFGCWHTREAIRALQAETGRGAVVVGVHNEDPWRISELLPRSIGEIRRPAEATWMSSLPRIDPQGEIFDAFLLRTVIPAVEARFPVKTGRENTAFCGSSMGGLMAFFTALSHPEVYAAAGIVSPCLNLYAEADLRRWIHGRLREEKPFLYLFAGGVGPAEQGIRASTEWFSSELRTCWPAELQKTVIRPDQPHHEAAWEPVFRDLLRVFLQV